MTWQKSSHVYSLSTAMMTKSDHQHGDDGGGGGGGDDDDDNYTSKLQGKWKPNNETWGRI